MAGENPNCCCANCRVRGLMGPVTLIAVGVIFLLGQYTPYGFNYLWPLLLIVPGIVMVVQALASREGHVGR
jgi:LiaI-LiaF-like transmembrane region